MVSRPFATRDSPTDSGYESSSPARNTIRQRLLKCNLSDSDALRYDLCDFDPALIIRPHSALAIRCRYDGPSDEEIFPSTATTLPRSRPRSFFRRWTLLKTFDSHSSLSSTDSRRSPDRFLPARRSSVDFTTHTFHAHKDPRTLTADEKLLRHKDASPDAFSPTRKAASSTPEASRAIPRRNTSGRRRGGTGPTTLTFRQEAPGPNGERQVSVGTVWTVGGLAPSITGVSDGRGGQFGNGTNAPLYTTSFSAAKQIQQEDINKHEGRLAEALELDRISRVLEFREPPPSPQRPAISSTCTEIRVKPRTIWNGTEWVTNGAEYKPQIIPEPRTLLSVPFKVLNAPNLRDDFYCSVLAYSPTSHTLAVGLGSYLYAWSEIRGAHLLHGVDPAGPWLTSLAFSSVQGCKCILAFGKSDGSLGLMSLYDTILPRFEVQQPHSIACVTWKPTTTLRASRCPIMPGMFARTEDLLVGDEHGSVYYFSVEWPHPSEVAATGWSGSMALLLRISAHTQPICGMAFNLDGSLFATGGNDNTCCLFQTSSVMRNISQNPENVEEVLVGGDEIHHIYTFSGLRRVNEIRAGAEKHRWLHGAAVKAIAFCPWREGLVATGGGSNDKGIHFFHTSSGACLATISVSAQVTSLIWSTTRREIAATFGYTDPDHPYRIAVFSWPECRQVAAIPWQGQHRALCAVSYPGGPDESQTSAEGDRILTRTAKEGCIVVASSDESIKFHEVWTTPQKATSSGEGFLGGSDILESLEGIDKEGDIIR
ncbi:WD40 repeat-like protein [Venustampulla echinocandica]|uniref:WD40 repeat-like protein n=1 Tax=Venustampulla echinocandica TaxID=2656787 RepID=A0A370TXG3_9HELO|nr:WD40 repeat-like protein [Venustampulla echinocandica]RDL40203.1 WD40 repeat-like protein [Venustampulla echinocandica]